MATEAQPETNRNTLFNKTTWFRQKNRFPSLEISFLGDSRLPPRDETTNEDQEILNHHLEKFRTLQNRDLLSQNQEDNAPCLRKSQSIQKFHTNESKKTADFKNATWRRQNTELTIIGYGGFMCT